MGRRALPRATGSAAKKETRGKKTRSRSTRAGSAGEGRHRPKPACAPARVTCPQAAFLHRPTQGVQRHEEGARDHGHRPGGDMVGYWRVGSVLFRSWLAGSERTKQRRVFRRCIRPLRAAGISHAFEVITTVKSDKVYRCVCCCRRAACCSGHAIPRHGVSCALFSDVPRNGHPDSQRPTMKTAMTGSWPSRRHSRAATSTSLPTR